MNWNERRRRRRPIRVDRTGDAAGHNRKILRRCVFRVDRQVIARTRPARASARKYARLGGDWRIDVQGAGGQDHAIGPLRLAWQAGTAVSAELIRETLRLGDLERANVILAALPAQRRRLDDQVRRVPGTRRLAAALTVTVIEPRCLAGDFVFHSAAQAAAGHHGCTHGPSKRSAVRLLESRTPGGSKGSQADSSGRTRWLGCVSIRPFWAARISRTIIGA